MKICTSCTLEKPLIEFYKYSGREGYRPHCIKCHKAKRKLKSLESIAKDKATRAKYLEQNKSKVKIKLAEYRALNKNKCAEAVKRSVAKNSVRYAEYKKLWFAENHDRKLELAKLHRANKPELYRQYKAKRRAIEKRASPVWADRNSIVAIYKRASTIANSHVDHIVPLISNIVCGLHCEFNLQIIDGSENSSKGNRAWPDMPDFTYLINPV